MPALLATPFRATVIWLGQVVDRGAQLASTSVKDLNLTFAGPDGEDHSGLTRASCARVTSQYDLGSEIRNTRQISIVSAEELAVIAKNMGLAEIDPSWIGASIVVQGIPDFSHIPPSSRLQVIGGACLVVDMENRPCQLPARVIETAKPGFGKAFKSASNGLRGVTGWVEQTGAIGLGDRLVLHVPDQNPWPHLARARALE
ncbi:MAG: MOSC domain-containing protein [Paracoccaceae bacterium]